MSTPGKPLAPAAQALTSVQWLICTIAAIGFAFDIYELLMLPLIVKTAIADLHVLVEGQDPKDWLPGGILYVGWARTLFFVPAIAGGVFGLLGGYLTDRLGRRTVLTWSILLYAFGAVRLVFHQPVPAAVFPLLCVCGCVCGVCGGGRVAGRAVPESAASAKRCSGTLRPSPRWAV